MSEKELIYLRDLVAFRDDLIKIRVSLGNRLGAKKKNSLIAHKQNIHSIRVSLHTNKRS
jgi:hypothetical protein